MIMETREQSLQFGGGDVEVRACMDDAGALKIRILKAGTCVHQIAVDDAAQPMEHSWIADLFAREDRIALGTLTSEAHDYLIGLDVNQG